MKKHIFLTDLVRERLEVLTEFVKVRIRKRDNVIVENWDSIAQNRDFW